MKYLYLISPLLFASCADYNLNIVQNETIYFDDCLNQQYNSIYQLVDSVILIPLETKDESILDDLILCLEISKDFVYLIDYYQGGSVAIFKTDGTFVRRIPRGNGPGEVPRAMKLAYDKFNDELIVYHYGHIKKYSADGVFKDDYKLSYMISDILPLRSGEGYIICQDEGRNPSGVFCIFTTDDSFNVMEVIALDQKTQTSYSNRCLIYGENDDIIISRAYDNNIYSLSDSSISIKYHLCYPNNELELPEDVSTYNYKKFQEIHVEGKFLYEGGFCETNNYELFKFESNYIPYTFYRSKRTGEIIGPVDRCSNGSLIEANLTRHKGSNGCFFISMISYRDFLLNYKANEKVFSPEQMEMLKNFTENDNPIIMLYSLKDPE